MQVGHQVLHLTSAEFTWVDFCYESKVLSILFPLEQVRNLYIVKVYWSHVVMMLIRNIFIIMGCAKFSFLNMKWVCHCYPQNLFFCLDWVHHSSITIVLLWCLWYVFKKYSLKCFIFCCVALNARTRSC